MKIAIVADVLGRENNGTTITIKRLISHLRARGHQVFVLSPSGSSGEGYFPLPPRRFPPFDNYLKKNGVVLAKPNKKLIKQVLCQADVVHIVLPFQTGRAALKICLEENIPFTAACHCQAENVSAHLFLKGFKPLNDFLYRLWYRNFYRHVRFVHCPSARMKDILTSHGYGMDIRVISNGVESAYQKKPVPRPARWQNKFVVLFVGRFSREKMHKTLIQAASRSKYKEKIQLVFAGDGPLKNELRRMGKSLIHPPELGFYAQEELIDLLNTADLYVHPSAAEIEAISCLEAIACGLVPVISDSKASATNAFALTEHNLFRNGDPDSLAQKIDYFIERPEALNALRERYARFAENFAIERSIDRMEEMFASALSYYRGDR